MQHLNSSICHLLLQVSNTPPFAKMPISIDRKWDLHTMDLNSNHYFSKSEFNCENRRLKSQSPSKMKIWTPQCCSGHQQWLEVLCDLIDSRVDRDPTPKIGMKFSCQFIDERSFPTTERKKNPQIGVDGIFRTLGVSSCTACWRRSLCIDLLLLLMGPVF